MNHNGLMAGSVFCVDTAKATGTVTVASDTAGTGELAGAITNPHDRSGKATTAITKSGTGTWTLSGTNSCAGPTRILQGTRSVATARSFGDKTDVYISAGAMLDLNFKGEMRIGRLYLDGKLQTAGTYSTASVPEYVKGTGMLKTE